MTTLTPAKSLQTYVFETSAKMPAGPRSIGVGEDAREAMQDALRRHAGRYSAQQVRQSADLTAHVESLRAGTARVSFNQPGVYPTRERMGHDYMSFESQLVAASFASQGGGVRETAQSIAGDSVDALRKALSPRFRQCVGVAGDLNREFIDWFEVRAEILGEDSESEIPDLPEVQGKKIASNVIDVLSRCRVEGQLVFLPGIQLDRKIYTKVDETLQGLGGKWNSKAKAHIFEDDPQARLEVAVITGTFVRPQDYGYFPTPDALAQRVIQMAAIAPGMRILEPSAGRGALALLASVAAGGAALVDCVELLPRNAQVLRDLGFVNVYEQDFMRMPVPDDEEHMYDVCIMNPPFNGGVDVDHVLHAARFVKPTGRLVSITSPSWAFRQAKKFQSFAQFVEESQGEIVDVPAGAFAASGTQVATKIIAMDAENFPWNQGVLERDRAEQPRGV